MTDQINDMRAFARMVDAGSLSAAARATDSSPAAMSRRLAALERRLGVRLVTRTSRRFELTAEGAQFHERVRAILVAVEEAQAEASAQSHMPRGLLRVGAPSEIGRKQIAPIVTAFSERYPEVEVRLVLSDVGLDVIDDNLDVALRIGLPADTGVIAKKLLSSRRVVVASPDYLARHGTPRRPADLAAHDCIRLVRGQRVFDRWRLLQDGEPPDRTLRRLREPPAFAAARAGVPRLHVRGPWKCDDRRFIGSLSKRPSGYECLALSFRCSIDVANDCGQTYQSCSSLRP